MKDSVKEIGVIELENQFNLLVDEYKNRKVSSYSSKTLIVKKLELFQQVLSDLNQCDKGIALHFLIDKVKLTDSSNKIVSFVLFKQFVGEEVLQKITEEFPLLNTNLDIISQADYFISIPEEKFDLAVIGGIENHILD